MRNLYFIITLVLASCSIYKPHNFDEPVLLNPEQTNLPANIISIEKGKELIIQDIIDSGYALPDGMVLREHPYIKDIEWETVFLWKTLEI
ncbi:MAG: hypothetical protein ACP5QT_05225 [Brevinematia bacterium]